MSEFDKEAEREKLREKYEADRQKREATEHMSELLLQGATMTNSHCDTCGSPIFRQNDQEFCPTCRQAGRQGAVEAEAGDGAGEPTAPRGQGQDAAADEPAPQEGSGGQPAGTPAETPTADGEPAPDHAETPTGVREQSTGAATADPDRQPREGGGGTGSPTGPTTRSPDRSAAGGAPNHQPAQHQPTGRAESPGAGDLGDAEASLTRTLVGLADRAERSEDLGRTREYLAGAREAAEALAAVRQAQR